MSMSLWRFAGLTLGLLVLPTSMVAQTDRQKSDPCRNASNITQSEMNECAAKDLQKAEFKLERLLKQLRIRREDPEQKAWEAYRDTQLAALYPKEGIPSYGSVYPMCFSILRKALTEGRIRDLKALIISREGDVCSGYRMQSQQKSKPAIRPMRILVCRN